MTDFYCDSEGAKPSTNKDIATFLKHRHLDGEYTQFIYELIARIKLDQVEPSIQTTGDEVV